MGRRQCRNVSRLIAVVVIIPLVAATRLAAAPYSFQVDTDETLLTGLDYYARMHTDAGDVSINGRTATSAGSPAWGLASGKVYSGVSLNASSGIQLNALPQWDHTNQWSFAYWYRVGSLPTPDADYLTVQQDSAGQFGVAFRQMSDGTLRFFLIRRSIVTLAECDGSTVLTAGSWYHVIVTYAGSGDQLTAYLNGNVECSVTESGSAGLSNGNVGVNLEVDNSQVSLAFSIDELGIWSKVLSAQERADLYNSGNGQTMTDGAPPPMPPIESFFWRGAYEGATVYGPGDSISFEGSTYVSVATDNAGNQPDLSSQWQLVARKGDEGERGPAGQDGQDGVDGQQGPPGPPGQQGLPGAPGPQGDPGPQGQQGIQGDQGPQGLAGPQGPAGSTGATGAVGPAGPQGPAGENGTSGSVIAGNYANMATGRFLVPWDADVGVEANANFAMPAGTAAKLVVHLTTAPGATGSVTVTVRKNGANTALACVLTGPDTTCVDGTHVVSFGDGDLLSVAYAESNAAGSRVRFGLEYRSP